MPSTPSKTPTLEPSPLEDALASQQSVDALCDVSSVVAVSGGPDSVALLRGLAALKAREDAHQWTIRSAPGVQPARLIVAHVHHGLRGAAADLDQRWVADLASRLDLPFQTRRVSTRRAALRDGDGLEAAARKLRYRVLRQIAHEVGARYLFVAHTADDQIETILHRLLRGTGLAGLTGMPRARRLSPAVTLVRPLLGVRRVAVLEYLARLQQPYCVDATNADRSLTRARIRHELLPLLQSYHPQADAAILRLGRLAGDAQDVIDRWARDVFRQAVERIDPQRVRIARGPLAGQPPYLVGEVMLRVWRRQKWPRQAMTFGHWRRLAALALGAAEETALTLPGDIDARVEGDLLTLSKRNETQARVKR